MGDRTGCALQIVGEISQTDLDQLYEEFEKDLPSNGPFDGAVEFEEVNYGDLDYLDSTKMIKERKFQYIWIWGRGGNYDAGIEMCDGEQTVSFSTIDGEIALTLSELDSGRLDEAKKWAVWEVAQKLTVI